MIRDPKDLERHAAPGEIQRRTKGDVLVHDSLPSAHDPLRSSYVAGVLYLSRDLGANCGGGPRRSRGDRDHHHHETHILRHLDQGNDRRHGLRRGTPAHNRVRENRGDAHVHPRRRDTPYHRIPPNRRDHLFHERRGCHGFLPGRFGKCGPRSSVRRMRSPLPRGHVQGRFQLVRHLRQRGDSVRHIVPPTLRKRKGETLAPMLSPS